MKKTTQIAAIQQLGIKASGSLDIPREELPDIMLLAAIGLQRQRIGKPQTTAWMKAMGRKLEGMEANHEE